jgi:hypothetical protein
MKKTMKIFIAVSLMAIGIAFAKTVYVSGPLESKTFNERSFTRLDIKSQFNVYLTQENEEKIVVETYKNLMPYVVVEKRNQTLNVYLDKDLNRIKWNGKDEVLNVYISVKELEKVELSGACDLYLMSPLVTEDLKISASGASDLELNKINGKSIKIITSGASDIDNADLEAADIYINASGASDGNLEVVAKVLEMIASGASDFDISVDVDDLKISAHGSSDFNARGKTGKFKISLSGSSEMKAYDLISDTVIVDASGGSNCKIHVIKYLDASTSGASTIYYEGKPDKTSIQVSGVSSIKSK